MTMRIVMLVTLAALVFPLSAAAEDPNVQAPILVNGRVQAPSVRVFLSRSRPSTDRGDLRASFTREIVSATTASPF